MIEQTKDILAALDRVGEIIKAPPKKGLPTTDEVFSVLAEVNNAKTMTQLATAKLNARCLMARILRGSIDGDS